MRRNQRKEGNKREERKAIPMDQREEADQAKIQGKNQKMRDL